MPPAKQTSVPVGDRLAWTAAELAKVWGISYKTVRRMQQADALPRPINVGGRVCWRSEEVKDWMRAGCPEPAQWVWHPMLPIRLDQAIREKTAELVSVRREIDQFKAELAEVEKKLARAS